MGNTLLVAEPAAPYAGRPPLVVDCSVVAALLFYEPARDVAADALRGKDLYAPELLDHEFVNVAVRKSRLGLGEVAETALGHFAQLRLARCRVEVAGQFRIAVQHELTGYDAAYLWLAAELGAPLVTFDHRLAAAARRHLRGA